jgi:hypothetical protein
LYNVKAHFGTNGTFLGCSGNVSVDTRYFTHMWVRWRYDGGGWGDVITNSTSFELQLTAYEFYLNVTPHKGEFMGWNYPSSSVAWYINGALEYETSPGGFVNWAPTEEDTYYFRLHYKGGDQTRPCTWIFIVRAQIDPLMVYFDVTPAKFAPGATVNLHAEAVYARSNGTPTTGLTFTFLQDGDWNNTIQSVNSSTGEATVDWTYPDQDVHTVTVVVQLSTGSQVKHMVEPVYLEVIGATTLRLGVNRTASSSHRFEAQLLDATGGPVANMPLTAYVNDTRLDENLVTNATGHVTFTRNFNPGQDRVAYTVEVAFEGTGNQTATLNGTDFTGISYTVCQTTQFENKPSSNMTSITVEPQVSDMIVPTKTTEEMEQEAKDCSTLRVWSEFSWWNPWFKVVAEVNVPLNGNVVTFRFEEMPLVFQKTADVSAGDYDLAQTLVQIGASVGPEVLASYIIGTFIVPRIAAHIASKSSPLAVFAVVLIYAAAQTAIAFALNLLLGEIGLLIAIFSLLMAVVIEAFLLGLNVLYDFIQAIIRGASGAIQSIWHSWWGRGLGFIDIVEATAFFFVDVGLGAFLATLL